MSVLAVIRGGAEPPGGVSGGDMGQCDDARYALLVHIDDDASDLSASKHERHPQPDMTAPVSESVRQSSGAV